jgi:hypothetical protein
MSFITKAVGNLVGMEKPKAPAPLPASATPDAAKAETGVIESEPDARRQRRRGLASTILSDASGGVASGADTAAGVSRKTLLGQ